MFDSCLDSLGRYNQKRLSSKNARDLAFFPNDEYDF